jgi:hypothetical protein
MSLMYFWHLFSPRTPLTTENPERVHPFIQHQALSTNMAVSDVGHFSSSSTWIRLCFIIDR